MSVLSSGEIRRGLLRRFGAVGVSVCLCALLGLGGCSFGEEAPAPAISDAAAPTADDAAGMEYSKDKDAAISTDPAFELLSDPRLQGSLCVIEYLGNSVAFIADDQVIGRIPVGVNPACVVSSEDGNQVYIANSGNGEVVRLTLGESPAIDKARIGTQPMALALDEDQGLLYVADYHLNSIRIVDTQLMSLVGTVALNPSGYESREVAPPCCSDPLDGTVMTGRKPLSLALSPDGAVLYSANIGTYDVSRVDLDAREELDPFDGVIGSWGIALSPDGARIALAGVGSELVESSELLIMDASDGTVVSRIPVGAQVSAVAWSADGSTVAATSRADGVLALIDGETLELRGTVVLEAGLAAVVLSDGGSEAYAVNSSSGAVFVVDTESLAVVDSIEGLVDPRFAAIVGSGE